MKENDLQTQAKLVLFPTWQLVSEAQRRAPSCPNCKIVTFVGPNWYTCPSCNLTQDFPEGDEA